MEESFTNTYVVQSRASNVLFTKIRDMNTNVNDFVMYSDRLMNILAEEGLASMPGDSVSVTTPTGDTYQGKEVNYNNICAVSIIRAGDSLLNAVRRCVPSISVGKILIQRNEESKEKEPMLYYKKLPPNISQMNVLLVDPMLATGGSACMAIQTLIECGVLEENILFLNVVACPEGLRRLHSEYPSVQVVTLAIDQCLNEEKYIVPGLGDYGDRYFGTI